MSITFPKKYMTVRELVNIGFTSTQTLNKWVHIRGFPAFKSGTGKTSKWYIDTEVMKDWIKEKGLQQ